MSTENTAAGPGHSARPGRVTVVVRSAAVLAFAFGAGTAALLGLTPHTTPAVAGPPGGIVILPPLDIPVDPPVPCNTACCSDPHRPAV